MSEKKSVPFDVFEEKRAEFRNELKDMLDNRYAPIGCVHMSDCVDVDLKTRVDGRICIAWSVSLAYATIAEMRRLCDALWDAYELMAEFPYLGYEVW